PLLPTLDYPTLEFPGNHGRVSEVSDVGRNSSTQRTACPPPSGTTGSVHRASPALTSSLTASSTASTDGHFRLLDFWISRAVARPPGAAIHSTNSRASRSSSLSRRT